MDAKIAQKRQTGSSVRMTVLLVYVWCNSVRGLWHISAIQLLSRESARFHAGREVGQCRGVESQILTFHYR